MLQFCRRVRRWGCGSFRNKAAGVMMKKSELKSILWDTFSHLSEAQLMALTIYGESRGESREGKIAVGSVILERVEHREWDGKTLHEVCLMPYQFSCYLPGDPNFHALKLIAENWPVKFMRSQVLQECYQVADGLIRGDISRTPEIAAAHCCQYKTKKASAAWAKKMKVILTIGQHEFYA